MKKYFLLIIVMVCIVSAQSFVESPKAMANDTLYTRTRCTHDFYFNSSNTMSGYNVSAGSIDLDIYAKTADRIAATDTMYIEAYGFKRKFVGSDQYPTLMLGDSTRVAAVTLSGTYVFKSYAIEQLYESFSMYDGVRIAFRKNGSDADSVTVYSNVRIYQAGK